MDRNVGIRGIIRPPKSPDEITEDARADARAMAAVIKKIGPINRNVSVMDPDDFGNIHPLQAADKPIKEVRPAEKKDKKFKYESWAGNKEPGKLQKYRGAMKWVTRPKTSAEDIKKLFNEETATDNELYAKLKNDPVRYTQVMSHKYDGTEKPKDYPRVTDEDGYPLQASESQMKGLEERIAQSRAMTGDPKPALMGDHYKTDIRFPVQKKRDEFAAKELKKAEMLVSKANARTVAQLTNLKNWSNNSKKVLK